MTSRAKESRPAFVQLRRGKKLKPECQMRRARSDTPYLAHDMLRNVVCGPAKNSL